MRVSRVALVALVAAVCVPSASAAPKLRLGVFDDVEALQHPATTFAVLKKLHVQVARMTLNWSDVATRRPASPGDPADPAYDWRPYDAAVQAAARNGVAPLLTIWGTPAWANGGRTPNYPPEQMQSLYYFAFAAASRYSGSYIRRNGTQLPAVRLWLAWNEPNNPVSLSPQFVRRQGRWAMAAPGTYAKICTAVYEAVHGAQEGAEVGCGATAPRGDDSRVDRPAHPGELGDGRPGAERRRGNDHGKRSARLG